MTMDNAKDLISSLFYIIFSQDTFFVNWSGYAVLVFAYFCILFLSLPIIRLLFAVRAVQKYQNLNLDM